MSNYFINFFSNDHHFCEMLLYGYPPEYMNAYTSLFISFLGFFGLLMNPTTKDIDLIYSTLVVNGFSSFLYHYTNQIGWGLMDRFSMVMLIVYCSNIFITISKEFDLCNAFYDLLKILQVWCIVYILTITGLHNEDLFNIVFGLFLFSLLCAMLFFQFYDKKFNINHRLLHYGWRGIQLITTGGIFWIITENLCYTYPYMKYLFGHSVWHIAVGLGGYYFLLIPLYIYNHKNRYVIKYYLKLPYLSDYGDTLIDYNTKRI